MFYVILFVGIVARALKQFFHHQANRKRSALIPSDKLTRATKDDTPVTNSFLSPRVLMRALARIKSLFIYKHGVARGRGKWERGVHAPSVNARASYKKSVLCINNRGSQSNSPGKKHLDFWG